KINWENNEEKIIKWKNGETGFPIIDAGMRELNQRGLMHNRLRMICASFLVKDLHVDWRIGEKYFAQKLADYDPAVNNGNWQWTASTGCDSQPYFRTFNPWLQQRKFDPNCRYIKKWVKELENLSPNQIHELEKNRVNGYYEKIVDHKKEIEKSKKAYLNA
ncbi:MAG: FAD-binding domain-containing protein, partial [Candidatus Diapherotrites archaeon]